MFIFSIYVEKIALWRDVELKYSPNDLHKPYIISKQKHIYYTFFTIYCMKVSRNCFAPDK